MVTRLIMVRVNYALCQLISICECFYYHFSQPRNCIVICGVSKAVVSKFGQCTRLHNVVDGVMSAQCFAM